MLELIDDGTMDTVLECPSCRKEIRYMSARRDEHGYIYDSWMKWASEEHEEDCGDDLLSISEDGKTTINHLEDEGDKGEWIRVN